MFTAMFLHAGGGQSSCKPLVQKLKCHPVPTSSVDDSCRVIGTKALVLIVDSFDAFEKCMNDKKLVDKMTKGIPEELLQKTKSHSIIRIKEKEKAETASKKMNCVLA